MTISLAIRSTSSRTSTATPTTCKPSLAMGRLQLLEERNFLRQGAHQVAQKLTTIDFPGQLRMERMLPSRSVECEVGQRSAAGVPPAAVSARTPRRCVRRGLAAAR